VRGHDLRVILNDGEKMAQLEFYRMSEDCDPEKKEDDKYKEQTLQLSNFFAEWK
jgi:deoxycytidine triphosphate deaminase